MNISHLYSLLWAGEKNEMERREGGGEGGGTVTASNRALMYVSFFWPQKGQNVWKRLKIANMQYIDRSTFGATAQQHT